MFFSSRFGEGYTVTLRTKGHNPDLGPLIEHMSRTFPSAQLREQHHNVLQYQLGNDSDVSLANIFSSLESVKDEFNIEDHSVSQTTLDQVSSSQLYPFMNLFKTR